MTSRTEHEGSIRQFDRALLVCLAGATVLLFARLGVRPVADPDAGLHLRIGTYLNEGGRFAGRPDPWSATAVRKYTPTQWLPERFGAWIFEAGGLPSVALLRTAASAALLVVLLWGCRRIAAPIPAAIGASAAFIGSAGALSDRPQAAVLPLVAICIGGWWLTLQDGRPRWWIIPLTWLAANVHGLWSVIILIGVLFAVGAILDDRVQWRTRAKLFLIPVTSVVVVAATPLGPALLLTPLQVAGSVSQHVQEWQAVQTSNPLFLIVTAMLLIIGALWVQTREVLPPSRALIFLTAVGAVLWSGRTVVIGALLGAGLLADALQRYRREPLPKVGRFEKQLVVGVVAMVACLSAWLAPQIAEHPENVPSQLLASVLELGADAIVLSAHEQSGWLMWESPESKVVFDLRSEIYSEAQISAFVDAMNARPGWEEYVEASGATHALLSADSPLADALGRIDWVENGRDKGYVLLASPIP